MKKYIFDFQLPNKSIRSEDYRENGANGIRFNDRAECLMLINTNMLMKTRGTNMAVYLFTVPSDRYLTL